jgi:glycosyltransferase involved in cell wall biosynthesis
MKKRMLIIVPRVPWPPVCGASLANCSLIQILVAQGWSIDLLCVSRSKNKNNASDLKNQFGLAHVGVIRLPLFMRYSLTCRILSFLMQWKFKDVPITAIPFIAGSTGHQIFKQILAGNWKYIIWDGLHPMAVLSQQRFKDKYGLGHLAHHIYRSHNCESELWKQYQERVNKWFKPFIAAQFKKMLQLEKDSIARAAATLTISEHDTDALRRIQPDAKKILTVPVSLPTLKGTNLVYAGVVRENSLIDKNEKQDLHLLWMGGMDWWPNKNGVEWFMNHVWPSLRNKRQNLKLCLIGQGTEHLKFDSREAIAVHGFVSDPKQLISSADMMIVPIFYCSGIRIKALEALSHAIPCIGTRKSLSGIPEAGCWFSDSADEWIEFLSRVTREECKKKGLNGRSALECKYSPQFVGQTLNTFFEQLELPTTGSPN